MRPVLTMILASLFVFLAGFNVWNMLTSRGAPAGSNRLWIQVHRAVGYVFIALFGTFCYLMLLRIKGVADELSPRLILHMGLAFLLAPLLLIKVIVARNQKGARGLLTALGIAIFASAFILVAVNATIHFLAGASGHKVPPATSMTVITTWVVLVGIAYVAGSRRSEPRSDFKAGDLRPSLGQEREGPVDEFNLTLARIESQSQDAKTLRFLLPRHREIVARPGQFMTFEWMIDGKVVTRSYSICSSPTQRDFIDITAKRVPNGSVSQFLNDRAQLGMTVKAHGAYGKFCFDETKHKEVVMIAGGSGITPMMSMLRYIDDLCIPTDITLIYCVRAEQDVFFKNELAALQGRLSNFRHVQVLSQPSAEWAGWKGRLRREILEGELTNPQDATFFLCGPPAFMELGRTLLKQMGIEPAKILQESFGGAVARETTSLATGGPLEIRFSRSRVKFNTSPDENLLESCERNGVLLPSGCRQGSCGTCATKVLHGRVEMTTEDALTEDLRSQGFVLPCVSRPITHLTLDA